MGNIKDNKMEILADKGNGNYAYIDSILEANKVLVKEMGGTLYTIAKDVKLQLEFNPAHVKAYRLIGYENRTLNKEDFNNDRKDAGEIGSGHSVTALYELIPASSEETISGVDPLKYQTTQISEEAKESKEMLTVKLRYKKPDGDTSILMTHTVDAKVVDTARRSENFTWSAAVAEFGLLLRNSEYKGQATWQMVIDTARSAIGKDRDGYRKEFISLAEKARDLMEAKGNTNPNPNPNPEYDKNRIENYK
jgi:Ca-activated chloride channel family protein